MAEKVARIFWQNLAWLSNSEITGEAQVAHPALRMKDQLLSSVYRSKLGWNIVEGFNDKLDFSEGGSARVATLTAGNYATGALMAAQIETAMDAAPSATNTYAVSYDSATGLFTIARDTGSDALALLASSGANVAQAAWGDLGYDASDHSGDTTYDSDTEAYKSRELIIVDLKTSMAVTAGAILGHNLDSSATVTLLGNTSDAWTSPGYSLTLEGDSIRVKQAASSQVYRYWAFLVDDVATGTDGFTEVGVAYVGTYLEPDVGYAANVGILVEDMSEISVSDYGAVFVDEKPEREQKTLTFQLCDETLRDSFVTVRRSRRVGKNMLVCLDADNQCSEIFYMQLAAPISIEHVAANPDSLWTVTLPLVEVVQ